jgi:tRNA wybutosine-synthesizing protein 1
MTKEIKKELIKDLKHKHYGIYGKHSAVEICTWNKKALRGEGVCYKQQFYNVDCHRCAQISPAMLWCHQNCVFCWRVADYMGLTKLDEDFIDPPEKIIEGLFKERKKLLSGFGGNHKVDKKMLEEAKIPSHVAISLSGEPTLYPKIGEMIEILKKRAEMKTVFLVTNGLEYETIKKINENDQLPTQLYLSIEACNKEQHLKINRPKIKDSWQRINKTIELYPNLKCRRIIRFTLIKNINDSKEDLQEFVKLFEKSNTDFVEIKAYMFIGQSREKLSIDNMPSFDEVLEYSKAFDKNSKLFSIEDSCKPSRIVLLKNKNSKYNNFIKSTLNK